MITFETISKLESATLKEGDLVQVLGEFSEGDVALMTGKVYPLLHTSSNRIVTIQGGLKVEIFPTPLGDKDVTKKYVNQQDDKIKASVNNLHTKREAIEWRAGLKVTDPLQLYVHKGVEYLPQASEVPFTTSSIFNSKYWSVSTIIDQAYLESTGTVQLKRYLNISADITSALSNASEQVKNYGTLDLCGLKVNIVHTNLNSNLFNPNGEKNKTCYAFFEKKDYITIKNGEVTCNLDMTSNSLVGFGFAGCKKPTFDNVHMNFQCSGIPSYSVNGYETFASLITCEHHRDGTKGTGFYIKSNCSFRINHPNGGSIGGKDGNPVHDYSGKLVGVQCSGREDLNLDGVMSGAVIEDGTLFYDCTARVVWMWATTNNSICGLEFNDCGKNDTEFCNYLIRVTHYGSNSSYDDNKINRCYTTSKGILISNNNSNRVPVNYSCSRNKAKDCGLFDIGVNAGINAKINENQFDNVVAPFAHIHFVHQNGAVWSNLECKGNEGVNISVVNPLAEATGFIYNSAPNSDELDISENDINGITANAAITQRLYGNKVKRNKIRNASNYGCYHGTGITTGLEYHENDIESCGNWGIGGFADSKGSTFRNTVKKCAKGIRCGSGANSIGDTVIDCKETHIEVRNGMCKDYTIASGDYTDAGSTALSNTGSASKLIAGGTISNNNSRFSTGIAAPMKTLLVNNGVFGTYSIKKIDTIVATVKLNNYDEDGVLS